MLAPLGLHVTHAWHADLNVTHACLPLHVCIHVALYTAVTTHVCMHVCLHPDLSTFSVCEHPGRSPV